jgi:SAM-dependent methyltransferase
MPPDPEGASAESGGSPSPPRIPVDACPTCGDVAAGAWLSSGDLLHGVAGTFEYRRCLRCRTVFQAPRVGDENLADCYPGDYFTHTAPEPVAADRAEGAGWRSVARAQVLGSLAGTAGRPLWAVGLGRALAAVPFLRARAALGMMTELVPTGTAERCLEIGPGTGADLARLRGLGWAVAEGLDVDADAAWRAATRSGCVVHVGRLDRFVTAERFDLIYASHSFEHLPSVRGSIVALRELLRATGRLVLILPNVDSMSTRLDRRHAVTVDAPRHLVLPPLRALRQALEKGGFRVEVARTTARRTAHYRAIARARRRGVRGTDAWCEPLTAVDRAAQGVARLLCALHVDVGEELVVVARKAG